MSQYRKTPQPVENSMRSSSHPTSTVNYNPYTKKYVPTHPPRKKKNHGTQLLFKSSKENDHEWIGDPMELPANPNITRLWFQNCNGMITVKDNVKFQYEINNYLNNDIHFMSFAETRLNVCHKLTTYQIEQSMKQIAPNSKIFLHNTPGYTSTSAYQPGGVAAAFYGRLQGRYVTTTRDEHGRWIAQIFKGAKHTLRVYTFYRVNPKNGKADSSAWMQQKRSLQKIDIDDDPRKHAVNAITEEVQKHICNGDFIIIMGDLNESVLGKEKSNDKLAQIGLTNVLQHRLQTTTLPRTHKRGSHAIDHIWISASLLNSLKACGYAPFDHICTSDHRGLYLDIHLNSILDADIYSLQPTKHRRLKSTIPKRVEKYLEIMEKKWEDQSINKRFEKGRQLCEHKKVQELEIELNKLDTSISEIMRHAEKKCSFIPKQNLLHWGPTLKAALDGMKSARLLRTRLQYIQPGQSYGDAKANFLAASKTYGDALSHYRVVKSKHVELRIEYLKDLANDLALKNQTSQACEINKLRNIEKQRGSHLKIGYVLKPDSRDGVHSISIPSKSSNNDNGIDHYSVEEMWTRIQPKNGKDVETWERITDRESVEDMLLKWQQLHFLQATETPFATNAWKHQLDDEDFQKAVMEGTYVPPAHLPQEARDLFCFMKRNSAVTDIPFQSTYDEFCEFIKKTDETTSVSPSGRLYSHYKTLLQGDKTCLQTIHAIIEMCTANQIILRRWKKTVTTLIEKEKGFPYIHRMRAIHIIEAEVQFIAKVHYVKKMMGTAEEKNLITEEQYGGRR